MAPKWYSVIFICLLVVLLSSGFASSQTKRTSTRKTQSAVVKRPALTDEQKKFLASLLKAGDDADTSYSIYMDNSVAYKLMELERKSFPDRLRVMRNLKSPECEPLPEPLASQVNHVLTSYEHWSDLFQLVDSGFTYMNSVQYAEKYRSILERSGFFYSMTQNDALRAFKSTAQNSKEKLRTMFSVYPRWINPDSSYEQYGSVFLVPIPEKTGKEIADPCKTSKDPTKLSVTPAPGVNKSPEITQDLKKPTEGEKPSLNFAELEGKWKVTINQTGTSSLSLIFIFRMVEQTPYLGIQTNNSGEVLLMPIESRKGNFSFTTYLLMGSDELRVTTFESTRIEKSSIFGSVTTIIAGSKSVAVFEASRL